MTYTCSQSNIVSSKTYKHSKLLHSPTYPTKGLVGEFDIISYLPEYLLYHGNDKYCI